MERNRGGITIGIGGPVGVAGSKRPQTNETQMAPGTMSSAEKGAEEEQEATGSDSEVQS
ncbi:hypothetical protein RAB80_000014 [Fusarium oxysporum f. sp. vasinfectum]|nr:hypothetical protein RAB80_000014 [Fusarium oxysporum f. sp. vasinfectum]